MSEVSGGSRIVWEGSGVDGRSGEGKVRAYEYMFWNLYHTRGNHNTIVYVYHN